MHRKILTTLGLTTGGLLLAGCTPPVNMYQPAGGDPQHIAYAAKSGYPGKDQENPDKAADLFCKVLPDCTIVLENAGDDAISDFDVWVNRLYTLHVTKLDARSEIGLSPKDIFNRSGENLVNMPASSISNVQIYIVPTSKLLSVRGPILPH